ncbi:hypothetical protein [Candidatus Contubernalis alkaliaceticus]|uniref:hypothetical protein n=1 Tax=Candidatus Contubernalis alkaliaceticus TaxID=338645 RepID=UPI001F4BDB41|nr:hypothetical protein [Candidatus Contubernalis alkalaceticus]UNC92565.1 hypothetical protein HUE98_10920 [Candidatus Contubernalis alkalaceticus]
MVITNRRGAVLVVVMISVSVLLLLGGVFLHCALIEFTIASNHQENTMAYYAAEAGVELAYALLYKDPSFPSGNLELIFLEDGFIEIVLGEIEGSGRVIVSSGYVGKAKETLTVVIPIDFTKNGSEVDLNLDNLDLSF